MSNYYQKRQILDNFVQEQIDNYPDISSYTRLDPTDIPQLSPNTCILFISQCFVDKFHSAILMTQYNNIYFNIIIPKKNLKCTINAHEYIIFYKEFSHNNVTIQKLNSNNANIENPIDNTEEEKYENPQAVNKYISYKNYFFKKKEERKLKKELKKLKHESNTINISEEQYHEHKEQEHKEQSNERENKYYERYKDYKKRKEEHKKIYDKYKQINKEKDRNRDFECKLVYKNGVMTQIKIPKS